MAKRAVEVLPSGVTHDLHYQEPYPIYIEKALDPRKWDYDGNEYIDYIGGHGALILGHSHPEIVSAIEAQAKLGTHPGAAHQKVVAKHNHLSAFQRHHPIDFGPAPAVANAHADDAAERLGNGEAQIAFFKITFF